MHFNLTTFVFELINFLVLLFVLQRFVFRPLRKGLAKRKAALLEQESAAKQLADKANEEIKDLAERARTINALREQALRDASVAAADERARILEQAREDAAADRVRAQRVIEAEREASEASVRELAITHSTALASKLLGQLAPEALDEVLVAELIQELKQQGGSWRLEPAFESDEEVEVTWAHPPQRERAETLERVVHEVVGKDMRVVHRDDGSLGAGAVMRLGHRVLDATTAGQLAAFRRRARALLEETSHG